MSSNQVTSAAAATAYLLEREQFGMRFGLERIKRLLDALGRPQDKFHSVHVVGTNGKSTTTRMIAQLLSATGIVTGSFTSPHLRGFQERITIDGAAIDDARFADVIDHVRAATEQLDAEAEADDHVTQFEAMTAAAYLAFAEAGVEFAVVEAGLGGRLDSTNVLSSTVQVLTSVALDHTELLGETEQLIAAEKLAVVPQGGMLICGRLNPEVERFVVEWADRIDAQVKFCERDDPLTKVLPAGFLRANASLALRVVRALVDLPDELALAALVEIAGGQQLAGRLDVISERPLVIYDAAHNSEAATALAAALPGLIGERRLVLVLGMLVGKQVEATVAPLVDLAAAVICTTINNPRSLQAEALAAYVRGASCRVQSVNSPAVEIELAPTAPAAVHRATELAGDDGAVVVTGSNYLLADLIGGSARSASF